MITQHLIGYGFFAGALLLVLIGAFLSWRKAVLGLGFFLVMAAALAIAGTTLLVIRPIGSRPPVSGVKI